MLLEYQKEIGTTIWPEKSKHEEQIVNVNITENVQSWAPDLI